jgi:hypothetical protein
MRLFPDIWRIPFWKSPLVFFTGEFSAPLVAGQYEWAATLQDFFPQTTLTHQAMYFFWDLDFTCDIGDEDYKGAIQDTPLISVYLSAKPNEPIFRQPFRCPKYYESKPIQQGAMIRQTPNRLQFGVTGILNQTAALLGKTSIKAIIQITAYEITEPDFKSAFMEGQSFPEPAKQRPPGLTAEQLRMGRENAQAPGLRTEEGLNLPL